MVSFFRLIHVKGIVTVWIRSGQVMTNSLIIKSIKNAHKIVKKSMQSYQILKYKKCLKIQQKIWKQMVQYWPGEPYCISWRWTTFSSFRKEASKPDLKMWKQILTKKTLNLWIKLYYEGNKYMKHSKTKTIWE